MQAVFSKGGVNPIIKKLTYDLCKVSHLGDPECEFLLRSIKASACMHERMQE